MNRAMKADRQEGAAKGRQLKASSERVSTELLRHRIGR